MKFFLSKFFLNFFSLVFIIFFSFLKKRGRSHSQSPLTSPDGDLPPEWFLRAAGFNEWPGQSFLYPDGSVHRRVASPDAAAPPATSFFSVGHLLCGLLGGALARVT